MRTTCCWHLKMDPLGRTIKGVRAALEMGTCFAFLSCMQHMLQQKGYSVSAFAMGADGKCGMSESEE